jgi:hypothetical protein
VPFYLVFVGLAVDIARRLRILEPLVGAAAVTALGYGALLAQDALLETPPAAYWTAPITFGALAVAWWCATRGAFDALNATKAPHVAHQDGS